MSSIIPRHTRYLTSQSYARCFSCKSKVLHARSGNRHHQSLPSFGIIAALNKQNIIGINGSLPWKHLPQDREHFVKTTRDRVLIIGRKSFAEENPTGSHVEHVRACIVLSKRMGADDLTMLNEKRGGPELKLARSFEEALCIASELKSALNAVNNVIQRSDDDIDCWVAGGASIYKGALLHEHLQEVNLTHVDMEIDGDLEQFEQNNNVTFFPMDEFHKIGFEEVSRSVDGICTFVVYKRTVAVAP